MSMLVDVDGAGDILRRQEARESAARTYARHLPIVPVRAHGAHVYGADGRSYLDFLSGAGTLALGHNHPVVVEALRGVLDTQAPLHVLDVATPIKDDFTTTLLDALPEPFRGDGRIHFCGPSGADAVEAALKLTRAATGRRGLLAFTGAYHGMTAGALAAGANTDARIPAGVDAPGVTRLPFPHGYRCPYGVGGVRAERVAADHLRTLLDDPSGGVTPPAALIVEPVQGEGGVVPAPDGWLRDVRSVTADRGIPMIVDEVQTGLGRTGALWAIEHSGIVPDVIVLSKAIGGGLPLAVIVYRAELDRWTEGAHAGTFRGNQLAMAAGAATIRHVISERLAERAADLGLRMRAELSSLAADRAGGCGIVGDVRGRGLMIGIEIVDPFAVPDALGARPAAPALAKRVRAECLSRGLIIELGGRHGAVVRLLPPLTLTDPEAAQALDILTTTLNSITQSPHPPT